jgi:5-aminolevulinate synthase
LTFCSVLIIKIFKADKVQIINFVHIFTKPMFDINAKIEDDLSDLKIKGNYRHFLQLVKSEKGNPYIKYHHNGNWKNAVNYCSNDYLSMSSHPDVIEAFCQSSKKYGVSSGGTRNISGTTNAHISLEKTLSHWHGKEAALLFGSAYMANLATLQTLGRRIPELLFFSDEKNHASLIEGMRSAGNQKIVFKHNDINDLEEKLSKSDPFVPKLIVFESIYSMNGHKAPVDDIINIAHKYRAMTYIDEVHAVGMYGEKNAGYSHTDAKALKPDIINGTLSKAIGTFGGYIAGTAELVDFVRSFGSGFIFTTSLPPAVCCAAEVSIRLLQNDTDRVHKMKTMVLLFRKLLTDEGIFFRHNTSHITPITVGNPEKCKAIADRLLHDFGIYIQPINYPTVPYGEECLRVIITTAHEETQIYHLVRSLKTCIHG